MRDYTHKKAAALIAAAYITLLFQNCSKVGFDDSAQAAASVQAPAREVPAPEVPSGTCAANAGDMCVKDLKTVKAVGCQPNYGCSDFTGIYYHSPNGCDPNTAGSWVEYFFDGTKTTTSGKNSSGQTVKSATVGDGQSAQRCTYIGFASYDPFHATANGQCINASALGYPSPNTFVRVVPGTGCYHDKSEPIPGVVQCDGSCK